MNSSLRFLCCALVLWAAAISFAQSQPFLLSFPQPTLDRWMYPFNTTPGTRPSAPVFGTLGDDAGVDSRHGQFLLGFDTFSQVATNAGARNYLVRSARLTAVISRDQTFAYDPTADGYTTYFETNHPAYEPDSDRGRPIELFGAGFRNGFTPATFAEDGPFGNSASGQRNAFAAGFDTNGMLVDVGNNVGKTQAPFLPFEVHPFAVGRTPDVAAGELVPIDTTITFELNLTDPLVLGYLQEALDAGRLRLTLSSYHTSTFGGLPGWPDFFTRDSVLGSPPTLNIEGTVITPTDTDSDGLPDGWEEFYFGSLIEDAAGDADADGQTNFAEFGAGTNPRAGGDWLRIVSVQDVRDACVLRFTFAASRQYVIEHSGDLRVWAAVEAPALVYYGAPGVVEWRDESSDNSPRFYRIRVR